jgi:paraquat-inducible protein B
MRGIRPNGSTVVLAGLLAVSGLGARTGNVTLRQEAAPARTVEGVEREAGQKLSERAERVLEQIRQLNKSELEVVARELAGHARALRHERLAEAYRDLSGLHERLAEALNRRPADEAEARKLEEEIRDVMRNRLRRSEQALRRAEQAMRLAEGRMRLLENRLRDWERRWQEPVPAAPPEPQPSKEK